MVTVNKKIVYDHYEYSVRCLSTDAKPTDVNNGTVCVEIDTGKKYMFDADSGNWVNHGSAILTDADETGY